MDFLHTTARQCNLSNYLYGLRWSREFTNNGLSIIDTLGSESPADPVLVLQNVNDDVVPSALTDQMVENWRAGGTPVDYPHAIDTAPLLPELGIVAHSLGAANAIPVGATWLADRFDGKPLPTR
ncbi:hypothetical protein GFY24_30485 [Nocardia sp. SYP-A9097]|uniref:lipase family protein n=1 Tax=Nocardia sp. SYP-A9097 TaxID=2663237 RepID=UPI001328A573|nr:lipase family protein [Nocardia sp. SYP-A9097]MRH91716.1 hypothetical protein [Nocardia sp. SYP-A9097]